MKAQPWLRLGFLAALVTVAAAADTPPSARQVTVSWADLDPGLPRDVRLLYARLTSAAQRVCRSEGDRTGRRLSPVEEQCARDTLDVAIHDTGLAKLSILHRTRTGRAAAG